MIIKQVLKPNVRATTKVLISGLIVSLATFISGCGGGGGGSSSNKSTPSNAQTLNKENYPTYAASIVNKSIQIMTLNTLAGTTLRQSVLATAGESSITQACEKGGDKTIKTLQNEANTLSTGDYSTITYNSCIKNSPAMDDIYQTTQGQRSLKVIACSQCQKDDEPVSQLIVLSSSDFSRTYALNETDEPLVENIKGDITLTIEGTQQTVTSPRYEVAKEVYTDLSFNVTENNTWLWSYTRDNEGTTVNTVKAFKFSPNASHYNAPAQAGEMHITLNDNQTIVVKVLAEQNGLTEITYQGLSKTMPWVDFAKLALKTSIPTVENHGG
ncbi:MAG: hypothetical protein L3J01_01905 [Thiomicrorhabdus sp.]|nr:hypothetical protein [Thiomicrorhabdus sp.]